MKTHQFIKALGEKSGVKQDHVRAVLTAVPGVVKEQLEKEGEFRWYGLFRINKAKLRERTQKSFEGEKTYPETSYFKTSLSQNFRKRVRGKM